VSETALGLLVHDGGVITPPSPILCAVRIGMRVEACAAAAFSISQTGSKRGTVPDDVVAHRQGLLTLPLSGMLDSRTAAAALAGRHPAEGNTLRRSSAGSLGLPAFRREPADSLGVWLQAMGIVYLEMVCVRN